MPISITISITIFCKVEHPFNGRFEVNTIAHSAVIASSSSVGRHLCGVQNYSMFLEHLTTELKEVFTIY